VSHDDVASALEGVAECWQATAIRIGRLAEALVTCCNIVLVRSKMASALPLGRR
jgi:hypothetical protein